MRAKVGDYMADQNPSHRRVVQALSHQRPDRVPLYDHYWPEFVARWRVEMGLPAGTNIHDHYGTDILVLAPDESPWPSRAGLIEEGNGYRIERDGYGAVHRRRTGAFFFQEVAVPVPEKVSPDSLAFESPHDDRRYRKVEEVAAQARKRYAIFGKVGGPYLRTSNLRGITQWLIDIAEDPAYAYALASRLTDHLIQVGLEHLRRNRLHETGLWIYDDMGSNRALAFSPRSFRRIFQPLYARMVQSFKGAGARFVLLHSDGDISSILDDLIDVGIDGVHPVEPKAGMDLPTLAGRYRGRLAFLGGLCNAHVLPRGTRKEIEAHVRRVLEAGREGGVILAPHSIGPDVPPSNWDWAMKVYRRWCWCEAAP